MVAEAPGAGLSEATAALEAVLPLLAEVGITLTGLQTEALAQFTVLLDRWNRRINLTARRTLQAIVVHHVLDCLQLERLGWPAGARRAVDIGSGAGLPALTVALLHPDCQVTALDTVAKKSTFQQEAARHLGLGNLHPLRQDVREHAAGPAGHQAYDLALARAFAPLAACLPLALELLRPGGQFWTFKGRDLAQELAQVPPQVAQRFQGPPRQLAYSFPAVGLAGVLVAYQVPDRAG